jgi:hypothetical protein
MAGAIGTFEARIEGLFEQGFLFELLSGEA